MLPNDTDSDKLVLDLIRHGEPVGGVRYRGSIDDPLSSTGWNQLTASTQGALDDGCQWQKIISSPMRRCREFAQQLSEKHDLPLEIYDDLRELGFGDLEGMTPQQAWQSYPKLLSDLWEDPESHTPPNGESFTGFIARVSACLNQIAEQHNNQHLLLVVHGGVIRASLNYLIGLSPKNSFQVEVPYAGMTRLTLYKETDGQFRASLNFINRYHGDKSHGDK